MAQDICYCREWEYFQPIDFELDPFGRDHQHTVNRLVKFLSEDSDAAYATHTQSTLTSSQPVYATEEDYDPEPIYDED
jgi:hypothetical protein